MTTWVYDDDVKTTTVTGPNGDVIVYRVDSCGRVMGLTHAVLGDVEFTADMAGRPLDLHAEGMRRAWRYERGQLVGYTEDIGGVTSTFVLEHDVAGNVVSESSTTVERSYRYDKAGQLISMEGNDGSWEWGYDTSGRVVVEQGPAGERRFRYDESGALVAVESADRAIEYSYDFVGRRIEERGGDQVTSYRWDDLGRLTAVARHGPDRDSVLELGVDSVGELTELGDRTVDWSVGPFGKPLNVGAATVVSLADQVLAVVDGDTIRWLPSDWRGSIGGSFGPWGPLPLAGEPADPKSLLGYLGEVEFESFIWLRNRVYDSMTHAFLSRDPLPGPLGIPGALTNRYQYAANNPLTWLDPLGLKPMSQDAYNAYAKAENQGHAKEIATAVLVVAAAAAVIGATGGLAAVATPVWIGAAVGGVAGAGSSAVSALVSGQPLDITNIVCAGAIGAVIGGGGMGRGCCCWGWIVGGRGRFRLRRRHIC